MFQHLVRVRPSASPADVLEPKSRVEQSSAASRVSSAVSKGRGAVVAGELLYYTLLQPQPIWDQSSGFVTEHWLRLKVRLGDRRSVRGVVSCY